jgi:RNA polymerase sigma factor (sigma-70 family)
VSQDAEDLVQDLCIRVYPRAQELESLSNPRAWLMRVLYRLYIDMKRRHSRSPLRAVDDSDGERSTERFTSEEPGPEEHTDGALMHERLERAWKFLSDEQCLLLTLHAIEGYSLEEIKQVTGLSTGTLKSRLHRARVRLGRLLEREDHLAQSRAGDSTHELPEYRTSVG